MLIVLCMTCRCIDHVSFILCFCSYNMCIILCFYGYADFISLKFIVVYTNCCHTYYVRVNITYRNV